MLSVLIVHNRYQQPGGEDRVTEAEQELLASAGHPVFLYLRDNEEMKDYGLWAKATMIPRTSWAWDSYRELKTLLATRRPDVVHLHNTFPLISPAAYYACQAMGVPVVQTLHNYRLFCPAATFFRKGRVCEECVHHSLWRSVRYGCYHNSRAATGAVATMLAVHRWCGTWTQKVTCYIVPSEFARTKLIEAGLPADSLVVKPNFVHPDPGSRSGAGDYALFVGRLSEEKGLRTLVATWQHLGSGIPLRIVGDGPLRAELEAKVVPERHSQVQFSGRLPQQEALRTIQAARLLIFPSECYENFPMTIVQAFACGVPVIASRLGALREMVTEGRTGLHFTPGDAEDLAAKIEWAWTHPAQLEEMARAARAEYEDRYTAQRNYQLLMQIYQRALEARV